MPGKFLLIPALFCRSVIFVLLQKLASWPRIEVQLPLLHMAGRGKMCSACSREYMCRCMFRHRIALKAHTLGCRKGTFLTCLHSQEFWPFLCLQSVQSLLHLSKMQAQLRFANNVICIWQYVYIYIYRDCNASVMHFVKESGIIAVRAIQRLLWVSPCQPTRHVQNVRPWDESFSLNRLRRDRNLWQFLFGVSCGWWWFCGPAVEWIFHVASGWIIHSKKFPFTLCLALHHLCCCRWTSPNIADWCLCTSNIFKPSNHVYMIDEGSDRFRLQHKTVS